jgi:hypothetical protein
MIDHEWIREAEMARRDSEAGICHFCREPLDPDTSSSLHGVFSMTDEEWLARLGVPEVGHLIQIIETEPRWIGHLLRRWGSSGKPILALGDTPDGVARGQAARDLLIKLNSVAKTLPRNPNTGRIFAGWIAAATAGRVSTINPPPPIDLFDSVERKLGVSVLVIEGLGAERPSTLIATTEVNWLVRRSAAGLLTIVTTSLLERDMLIRWRDSAAGILSTVFWSSIQSNRQHAPGSKSAGSAKQEDRNP